MRVLIVDDVRQVRQDLRVLLELSGEVEVVGEAPNGREAIRQAGALRPDAVLLDLAMPEMDGYAAAREIKTRWPACRLIAFSVHDYPQARQIASRAGVDGFVEKGAPLCRVLRSLGLPGKYDHHS